MEGHCQAIAAARVAAHTTPHGRPAGETAVGHCGRNAPCSRAAASTRSAEGENTGREHGEKTCRRWHPKGFAERGFGAVPGFQRGIPVTTMWKEH